MEDLIDWFKAALDDDERVAQDAGETGPAGSELFVVDDDYRHNTVAIPVSRVLAEVAAKRRILERHAPDKERPSPLGTLCRYCSPWDAQVPWPCPDLLDLALPYADRAGFREEWRP
jgi:hypothetical protein